MPTDSITVLWRTEEESWNAFVRRIRDAKGEIIVVLSSPDNAALLDENERGPFLEECAKIRYRLRFASKEPEVIRHARRLSIRVIDRTRALRRALQGHERSAEALRHFSPSLWRQQWRSRLQTIGLLSVPKVRIWILILLSVALFAFVLLRLLPSADVRLWPRSDVISQTMNITLVASGAVLPPSGNVRTLPLEHIRVHVKKSITFDDISPEFTGTNATVEMTVFNVSKEPYSLRKGTRLLNQAGMVFRLQDVAIVEPGGKVSVPAKADDVDLYGKIIGARGNVPADLQWEFPGLAPADRKLVYAKNLTAATGGTTSSRTVLQQKDIDIGKKRLVQDLLVTAKQLVEEERQLRSAADSRKQLELLSKDDVISIVYTGFVLPKEFLGQPVLSVPIEGELIYTVPAYDLELIRSTYSKDLHAHTGDGKQLIADTVHVDPQKIIIIEFDDNLRWIKVTVDITGTEQFVLDPLMPMGARFGRKVRDAIAGLSVRDAQRILRNFPEVDRVDIRLWPPWAGTIPTIPSNINISPQ